MYAKAPEKPVLYNFRKTLWYVSELPNQNIHPSSRASCTHTFTSHLHVYSFCSVYPALHPSTRLRISTSCHPAIGSTFPVHLSCEGLITCQEPSHKTEVEGDHVRRQCTALHTREELLEVMTEKMPILGSSPLMVSWILGWCLSRV